MKLFILCIIALLSRCNSSSVDRPVVSEVRSVVIEEKIDSTALNYIMGHFNPEEDSLFVEIPKKYADREGMYLRKETLSAFLEMYEAAKADDITLQIRSATRNFEYQKGIWERKWTGATILSDGVNAATDIADPEKRALKILEYSSMPGTSRHHWGTDLDLNAFSNAWFEEGDGLELYNWMLTHAAEYGFCQPYTAKNENRPEGYNEEKWHWSYTPLSGHLTLTAEKHITNDMITGFAGAEQAGKIDVVRKYILGINQFCK